MDERTKNMIERILTPMDEKAGYAREIDTIQLAKVLIELEERIENAQATADNIANNANISTI